MLAFTQVISKACNFKAALKTESAITNHHLEETAHRVTPPMDHPKTPHHLNQRTKDQSPGPKSAQPCLWCGYAPHVNLLQMTHAMGVENTVTGNTCAEPSPSMLYQSQLRALTPTPRLTTLLLMRFIGCNLQPKEFMWTSTSVTRHCHPRPSTSDLKLTLIAYVIPFMLVTSTAASCLN